MKRLVVLADGTWNTAHDEDEGHPTTTNVFKMSQAVHGKSKGDDGIEQKALYHDGVGAEPNFFEKAAERAAKILHIHTLNRNLLQGATGDGLDKNIIDCYRWLVQNYEDGDQIFLFGFSRGAYTVRSLAGLIRNSGLLHHDDMALVEQAFQLYRARGDDTHPNSAQATAFREANSFEPRIRFIGVWDTVGALGIPIGLFGHLNHGLYEFHDVRLSGIVDVAYHALAIDEHRKPFAPSLWEQQADSAQAGQVLVQRWFSGAHSNVGGGYAECGLSDNTFNFIAEGARRAGLQLDEDWIEKNICHSSWNGELRDSLKGLELLGRIDRTIGTGDLSATREEIDANAIKRRGQIAPRHEGPYAPANLDDYLERNPAGPSA